MSEVTFTIEDRNPILDTMKLPPIRYHKKVTFSDGTVLNYYFKEWIYQEKHYRSLEELLDHLPESVRDCIIFNLEIFRKI
jgi:hypothetical protein